MNGLLNKMVNVKKLKNNKVVFDGDVLIIDKVLTNMAVYHKSPIMNNSSMDVYIGSPMNDDSDAFSIIMFQPNDIVKVYS